MDPVERLVEEITTSTTTSTSTIGASATSSSPSDPTPGTSLHLDHTPDDLIDSEEGEIFANTSSSRSHTV